MATKPIAEEIAELRAMPVPELVVRYEELHGRPPRSKNRQWLWRRCAWKVQELRFGGLSQVARRRLDVLIAELDLPLGEQQTIRAPAPSPSARNGEPPVGTSISRTWRGREVTATRTPDGWEHDGVVYRSLSGLAKAVSGSHVSGRAWFGLTQLRRVRQ